MDKIKIYGWECWTKGFIVCALTIGPLVAAITYVLTAGYVISQIK